MHTQLQSTVQSRLSRHNYRTTARIVGLIYLAGMVVAKGFNTSSQVPSEPTISATPVVTPPLVGSTTP
jgi:hypothetical protein